MYQIFSAVKTDSLRHFNNLKSKSHIIITTSDVLVGPKIQTCFTPAHLTEPNDEPYNVYEWIGNDKLREKLANKCFSSLHSTNSSSNHFSFLMALQTIHHPRDFSGLFVWRLTPTEKSISTAKLFGWPKQISYKILRKQMGVTKLNYKLRTSNKLLLALTINLRLETLLLKMFQVLLSVTSKP